MAIKRKTLSSEGILESLEKVGLKIVEQSDGSKKLVNTHYEYVQTKEYEDWLVNFLDKHKSVSSWEDLYLYNKPENISDDDVEKIFLLGKFWDYIILNTKNIKHKQFEMQGNKYKIHKEFGCGCYDYYVELIKKEYS